MTQVAILGAGVAGLSAGWMLKNKGVDFIILEKKPYPGGLARSFLWNGFHCDFAAHRLFTTDEAVLHELLRLVPMGRHIRRSKIFLGGHWLRDPLDVLELSTHLSLAKRLNILWTYIFRPKKLPEDCFKNFVLLRYGKGLYKKVVLNSRRGNIRIVGTPEGTPGQPAGFAPGKHQNEISILLLPNSRGLWRNRKQTLQ
jgi:protoporphyrinogen oxidase